MLKITILGSGNFIPTPNRHSSGHLFQTNKENVIFDFGRGTIDNLLKNNLSLYDIDTIFISHFHSDHLSDICAFLGWATVIYRIEKIKKKVKIYGPKGLKKSLKSIMEACQIYKDFKKIENNLEIIEIKEGQIIKTKNLTVEGFNVNHSKEFNSFSYRIGYQNKIICYSGDSPDCRGLRKAAKNSDLFIAECTLPRKEGVEDHISGDELGALAQQEGIKKLAVVHIDKDYRPFVLNEIREKYTGKVIIARDMDKFNF